MSESNRQIKLGALISYTAILLNTVITLLYTPWMARQLGQSDYALYNLAFSFVRMFMNDFGLSSAVSRFAAKYRAENRDDEAGKLIGTITHLYLIIDAVIFAVLIVVYFFIDRIYQGLTPAEIITFRKLYMIIGFQTVLSFPFLSQSGILTAYEKFIQLKVCDLVQKLLTVGLIVLALLRNMDVVAVMAAYASAGLIMIVVKAVVIRKTTDVRADLKARDPEVTKAVMNFSVWVAIQIIAQSASMGLAPTIMGIVSNSTEIAVYSPANTLEGYYYMIASAVNGLFLARISRMIAEHQDDRLFRLMVKVGRYQLVVMGLLLVGYISIGRNFMITWMGSAYEKSYYCAVFLFIPDLLQFSEQIANTTAIARNEVRYAAKASLAKAAVFLLISFPLCSKLGSIGAALAVSLSYLVEFIYMNVIYHRVLNLDIRRFFKDCYHGFAFPYVGTAMIGLYLSDHVFMGYGWKNALINGVTVAVLYGILVWLFTLSHEEKKQLKDRISSTMRRKRKKEKR